jgi:hypothetical protein
MNAHSFHLIYLTKQVERGPHGDESAQIIALVVVLAVVFVIVTHASFRFGVLCSDCSRVPVERKRRPLWVVVPKYLFSFLFIDSYLVC